MNIKPYTPPPPEMDIFDALPNGTVFRFRSAPSLWMRIWGGYDEVNCVRLDSGDRVIAARYDKVVRVNGAFVEEAP